MNAYRIKQWLSFTKLLDLVYEHVFLHHIAFYESIDEKLSEQFCRYMLSDKVEVNLNLLGVLVLNWVVGHVDNADMLL